jgi:hypothetical protein
MEKPARASGFFLKTMNKSPEQLKMFAGRIELKHVNSVIGSGYEADVAKLAIIDKVAYRAARKNMQVNSAIILLIDDEFSGFFTFQVNHDAKEFCLLQSAMYEHRKDKEIYAMMAAKIIEQNTFGYPMVMTVSAKHDLERPEVFEALGFQTYLKKSDFHYMVYGKLSDIRLKLLAHIAMTNLWDSTTGDWLRVKREWNDRIEDAGLRHGVANPKFASREGCWQGASGTANVVLSKHEIVDGEVVKNSSKTLNGNASVLDPAACEVILRMFMPKDGRLVYNPFGGGVQMGFIAGGSGYNYIASEIRQNQCDANNKICSDFESVKWVRSDSTKFKPEVSPDLVFSCPPYYKVEEYLDYDGNPPDGELNSSPTYEQFRDLLFAGYSNAIDSMKDDTFFVIMTGDSRGKDGGYYGCEAEHELFFKQKGLLIYNRIVYLESEFTRRAMAKKTLHHRKFPKCEQKIYAFFKGKPENIKAKFPAIGRL